MQEVTEKIKKLATKREYNMTSGWYTTKVLKVEQYFDDGRKTKVVLRGLKKLQRKGGDVSIDVAEDEVFSFGFVSDSNGFYDNIPWGSTILFWGTPSLIEEGDEEIQTTLRILRPKHLTILEKGNEGMFEPYIPHQVASFLLSDYGIGLTSENVNKKYHRIMMNIISLESKKYILKTYFGGKNEDGTIKYLNVSFAYKRINEETLRKEIEDILMNK